MNGLASRANGEQLLINDNVKLFAGSHDEAAQRLDADPRVGLIPRQLRSREDRLTHAGILFGQRLSLYTPAQPDHRFQTPCGCGRIPARAGGDRIADASAPRIFPELCK